MVTALGTVYDLDISNCTRVRDVSNLGKVRFLNIDGCTGVTDASALDSVVYLSAEGTSVPLEKLKELSGIHHTDIPGTRTPWNCFGLFADTMEYQDSSEDDDHNSVQSSSSSSSSSSRDYHQQQCSDSFPVHKRSRQ